MICQRCGNDTEKRGRKYCPPCSRLVKQENAKANNEARLQTIARQGKHCKNCKTFFIPKGSADLYCEICGPTILKKKERESIDKYRERNGVKVGIGSGNYFGKGSAHPSYKTGVANYRELAKENKESICERCKIAIDFSNWAKWCVHHKDHNRENNSLDNLELLCKRCHQLEHKCWESLPQFS